jgi:hypothetical protein
MLLARGVEIDTINELITAGFATATMKRVGRRATIKSTRVKITEAGHWARFCLRPQSCGPAGTIVSLDEAEAAFRAAALTDGAPPPEAGQRLLSLEKADEICSG